MDSNKRKAPDEVVVASGEIIHRDFPESDISSVRDSYYANLYTKEVDFRGLSKQDAEFAAILKGNGQLDFSDPAAVLQLTKTLLKLDFGLKIELPGDRLCPPIPNRHNYILWLKELMDTTSYSEPGRKLRGIDIGTGASCIYPLLGATQRPWCFIATDVDPESLDYARRNVAINGLEDRIQIVAKTKDDAYLLPLNDCIVDKVDFTMSNPPFYESEADLARSAKKKARPPNSACTGAPVEMVVEGGEVAFVGRLLQESLHFRDRVQWYTSMFGKLPSLHNFIEKLRQNGIDNYAVTEFVQGKKTKRWAVGWSFGDMRPSDKAARGVKATTWRSLLPCATWVEICSFSIDRGVSPMVQRITAVMASLELISWVWETEKLQGIGRARENVWSRAWRRKKKQQEQLLIDDTASTRRPEDAEEVCKLGFLLSVRISRSEATVGLRWLEGHHNGLFESLSGYIKSQLSSIL
ncbi:hypothetical protein CONLIGDRAFT_264520 [Coniochaeta ligniaria NRRL 30616]|uniref:U6 small nuclear RNA (adenine-(43)-N(6))-methyltransferase n=1 Tax=Coniochaeta ligniaria NRRL 30616 TaxID=1408157 RepID=A0A1J7IYB4_9PEZI|nr:hypothetical protein CONLIGDRAFT_264520 [Coniochaeta ligniaria NRRL 30616]